MNHWSIARKMMAFCCASNADSCDDNSPDATARGARAVRADGFVGVALAVLFENGFANHFGGHLLLDRQVIRVGKAPSSSTGE
jgi:hypothetical protein